MTGKIAPSISIRFERRRADQVGGQRRHDLRQGQVPGYVDRARSSSNSVLLPPLQAPELRRRCEALAALQPGRHRKLRSNAAVALVGVLSFSKEAQRVIAKLPHKEQDRRILESTREACASLGVELTGLVVHRDESALHAHLQVVARHEDGGPVDLGRKACSALQDAAARAWHDLGIRRGTPKRERQAREEPASRWVHRSVRQLHEDLPAEIEEAARLGRAPQPRRARVKVRRRDWVGRLAAALGLPLTREKEIPVYRPQEVGRLLARADGSLRAASERRQQLQEALQRLREAQRISEEAQQRIHELERLLELKEGRTRRLEKELASAQKVLDVLPRLAIQRAESKIKKRLEELPPAPEWNPDPEP